jgi:hypothetical protein
MTVVITLPISIHHHTIDPSQRNFTRKEIKGIQVVNQDVKWSLFKDYIIS